VPGLKKFMLGFYQVSFPHSLDSLFPQTESLSERCHEHVRVVWAIALGLDQPLLRKVCQVRVGDYTGYGEPITEVCRLNKRSRWLSSGTMTLLFQDSENDALIQMMDETFIHSSKLMDSKFKTSRSNFVPAPPIVSTSPFLSLRVDKMIHPYPNILSVARNYRCQCC